MADVLVGLLSKPWLGSILGVIGIIAAFYFFLKSKNTPRLAFQRDAVTLVGSQHAAFSNEVEIRFAGGVVPRVTSEKVILWNAGNTTLNSSQIATSDPLRIVIRGDGSILKADILRTTRDVNRSSIELAAGDAQSAYISFDFLDPSDGVVFEILHSGKPLCLEVRGTLQGMPSGLASYGVTRDGRPYVEGTVSKLFNAVSGVHFILYTALTVGFVMAAIGLFASYIPPSVMISLELGRGETAVETNWSLFFAGTTYASMSLFVLWGFRRRYPASLDYKKR